MVARFLGLLAAAFVLLGPAAHADETPSPSSSPATEAGATETPAPDSESATPGEEPEVRTDGPGIGVTLIDNTDTSEGAEGTPIEGVTLVVVSEDGDAVGEGVTDEDGTTFIPLEDLGTYSVQLDQETLPEGVELNDEEDAELENVRLILRSPTFVDFPIGVTAEGAGFLEKLPTYLVSGVKFGLIVGLAALGLSLIWGTTGLTNFAHGEMITLGSVLAYVVNVGLGVPVIPAGIAAVVLAAGFGWLQDRLLWRPLRRRGSGLVAMMIVSIGFGLFLRYVFQYLIGGGTRPLSQYTTQQRVDYGPVELADKEIAIILTGILSLAAVGVLMMATRLGKSMRAVSDNPALASASGIRVDGVMSSAWILGTALTGISGVMLAVNSQVNFLTGYKLLLLVFAAVILGGLGTIWGAMFGAMVVGLMIEVGPLFGVPGSIKEVGALGVLILVLLFRPQGLLGRLERVG